MEADLLVIGSGIAGLSAALKASAFCRVILATKKSLTDSNTWHAQGGMAAVFGRDDSVISHVQDTLRAGDGLTNEKIARILAEEAPSRIIELKQWGAKFESDRKGFILSREAVHSRARIVHAADATGREVETLLAQKSKQTKNLTILEHYFAVDLLMDKRKCIGAIFLNNEQQTKMIFSRNTIVATGGIGQIYEITSNPDISTGDGIAMAFRAGADLEDMEFVQFHPTMLHGSDPPFLISETLRGEGGILKNCLGKAYMRAYHRDGDLAPRDVVSKFSVEEMEKTKSSFVHLDVTHFDPAYLQHRFPTIFRECMKQGIDIRKQMIPVSPTAHYMCGGIKTDECARTTIPGLYAIGECACTQLHGADRLASNSLTEGLVFGHRAVEEIKKSGTCEAMKKEMSDFQISPSKTGEKDRRKLRQLMWKHVGIIRCEDGLKNALKEIRKMEMGMKMWNKQMIEVSNMLLVAKCIAHAALLRKESRGTHFLLEYPERDDVKWKRHIAVNKDCLPLHGV